MGYCPRLPAAQLALALLLDRIRTTVGQAGAVFRLHPAGSTVPVMVISGGAIAFLVLSTVSIRVLHPGRASTASSAAGTSPMASAAAIPITGTSQGRAAGPGGPSGNTQPGPGALGGSSLVRSPAQAGAGGRGQGNGSGTSGGSGGSGSSGSGSSSSGTTGTGTTGSWTAGGTTLTRGADPTSATAASQGAVGTAPAAGVTTPPAAPPAAAANPAPSPRSSSSPGGVCVDVGPLGICLDV